MTSGSTTVVRLRGVSKHYGPVTAVAGLDLDVHRAEVLALLGPNGAGKTTVVRLLTTLAPIQTGEIRVFGLDARRDTMDIRYNLGYVPQQVSIETGLTGRQNIEWIARLYDLPKSVRAQRIDESLESLGLADVADKLAGTYSGGMVRRLELAQALVTRPSLLILDEPTVGLDPLAREGVWTEVRRMQEGFGMTVLITTHYMEEADALCDRVVLMDHGRLQAAGTPAELKRSVGPGATLEDVFRRYAGSDLRVG